VAAESKSERVDKQVKAFLASHLAHARMYQASLRELWDVYRALGLPNADFVAEFTSGKKPSLSQRGWEMLLARHLHAQGHRLSCPGRGPDFRFEHNGLVVWVEAIAPEPRGIPTDWMTAPRPGETMVGSVPHDQILLRWTAAFKEKSTKLDEYIRKGIVSKNDAYVIAINGCQLGTIPLDHGISRFPLALETVFPVGPLAMQIDQDTGRIQNSVVTERFGVLNANGSPVPTTPFVDPAYGGVSTLMACSMDRSAHPNLPAYVVHNPLARVPVPERILGSITEEWWADPVGTAGVEYDLKKRGPLPD
jgi:hypothetical protein